MTDHRDCLLPRDYFHDAVKVAADMNDWTAPMMDALYDFQVDHFYRTGKLFANGTVDGLLDICVPYLSMEDAMTDPDFSDAFVARAADGGVVLIYDHLKD